MISYLYMQQKLNMFSFLYIVQYIALLYQNVAKK
jgi:hypothetical protein